MSSEIVETQSFAVRIVRAHAAAGRLASTYLLTGGEASEREAIAVSFAQALNCERKKYFESCDCLSCRKIANRNHPDVAFIGFDPDLRSLKIEEVRQTAANVSFKPYEGKFKVVLVAGAERLTADASNAFLRTLEEPPPATVFVLMAEHKGHLLETIQSRGFEIRLRPDLKTEHPPLEARKDWDEFLEPYHTRPREEAKEALDSLLTFFWNEMRREGSDEAIRKIDAVIETKEALQANVNQKLALTRLAVKLK